MNKIIDVLTKYGPMKYSDILIALPKCNEKVLLYFIGQLILTGRVVKTGDQYTLKG